jgi:hypothetical protein
MVKLSVKLGPWELRREMDHGYRNSGDTREKHLRMLVVCMQMTRMRHRAIVNICKYPLNLLQQWSSQTVNT